MKYLLLLLIVDSDSDNFQSLKKTSKTKQNGLSKQAQSDADGIHPGTKEGMKSPAKPPSTQGTPGGKHAPVPVTPKSAPPPQPKQTPTSVFDYFGSGTVQRSDKKLVASAKRKAVSLLMLLLLNCEVYSLTINSQPLKPYLFFV